MDCIDCGLYYGMDYGLYFGLKYGLDSPRL